MSDSKKIEIFVCGVQKAGTTSLYAHLREHPELSPPLTKEIHFFDAETVNWSRPDYTALDKWFDARDGRRLRFEATPIYSFWPPSIERLSEYNRDAKLIFLFRDPFERALSQWQMEYARGNELLPFSVAIRSGLERLDGLPPLASERRVYPYIERGLYGEQVSRALRFFPRRQLLFLRSCDLWYDHIEILARVAKFLGISPFGEVAPKRENTRPEIFRDWVSSETDIEYVAELVRPSLRLFSELTDLDVSHWPTMMER
jgi:hypothetical protein